jgi:hypothetical protein
LLRSFLARRPGGRGQLALCTRLPAPSFSFRTLITAVFPVA